LGTWAGVVAEKPGDVRECACAGQRRHVERPELTRLAHGIEREKWARRGNGLALANWACETERERERESERAK
jgi:hypothetical protein